MARTLLVCFHSYGCDSVWSRDELLPVNPVWRCTNTTSSTAVDVPPNTVSQCHIRLASFLGDSTQENCFFYAISSWQMTCPVRHSRRSVTVMEIRDRRSYISCLVMRSRQDTLKVFNGEGDVMCLLYCQRPRATTVCVNWLKCDPDDG